VRHKRHAGDVEDVRIDRAMMLVTFVNATQLLSALAWLMVSIDYAPNVIRLIRHEGLAWDAAGAWAFALGLVQTGFTLRWLALAGSAYTVMASGTLIVWATLYLANATCALGILYTWRGRPTDFEAARHRARMGLMMWLGVFSAAFLLLLVVR
jgi:hypothetical protein